MTNVAVRWGRLSLTVTYEDLFLPFDLLSFTRLLAQEGYILTRDLPLLRMNARIEGSGPLATKGDSTIIFGTERRYWGVATLDPKSLVDEFEKIEDLLYQNLAINSAHHAHFYELIVEGTASSGHDPRHSFASLLANGSPLSAIRELLDQPAVPFSLRLAPPDAEPTSSDWLDVRIEPSISQAREAYLFSLVLRKADRNAVLAAARDLPTFVPRLVQILEESTK